MPKSIERKARPRSAKLGDVVSQQPPLLHPEESVQQAGDKMRDLGAENLFVSDDQRLVGMIDQTDPDRRAVGFGHDPNATTVGDIMVSEVAYCLKSDDCAEALRKMNEAGLDRLPVVDQDMRIVGVVTRADFMERVPGSMTS